MATGVAEGPLRIKMNNLKRCTLRCKLTASGAGLAAKKAASNRGRGRGRCPIHIPKKIGLSKSKILVRLVGREAVNEDNNIMGDMAYCERKGVTPRQGRASSLH